MGNSFQTPTPYPSVTYLGLQTDEVWAKSIFWKLPRFSDFLQLSQTFTPNLFYTLLSGSFDIVLVLLQPCNQTSKKLKRENIQNRVKSIIRIQENRKKRRERRELMYQKES